MKYEYTLVTNLQTETYKDEKIKEGLGGSFSYFELGDTIEMESLLRGKNLPTYTEFARYLFGIDPVSLSL